MEAIHHFIIRVIFELPNQIGNYLIGDHNGRLHVIGQIVENLVFDATNLLGESCHELIQSDLAIQILDKNLFATVLYNELDALL